VQDPYCLRCQPQVVGACLDQLRHAARVLLREANAVTDNPLVFARRRRAWSPVATSTPSRWPWPPTRMALAIAEVGAIAERRIAMLIDSQRVAPAAVPHARTPGLNSGFMIAHVTAAALASREQVAGAPGQRGQPAHQRQPGRPCVHGHLRRAPSAAHDRTTLRTSSASSCWPRPRASSSCAR